MWPRDEIDAVLARLPGAAFGGRVGSEAAAARVEFVAGADPGAREGGRPLLWHDGIARHMAELCESVDPSDFADESTRQWILDNIKSGAAPFDGASEPGDWPTVRISRAQAGAGPVAAGGELPEAMRDHAKLRTASLEREKKGNKLSCCLQARLMDWGRKSILAGALTHAKFLGYQFQILKVMAAAAPRAPPPVAAARGAGADSVGSNAQVEVSAVAAGGGGGRSSVRSARGGQRRWAKGFPAPELAAARPSTASGAKPMSVRTCPERFLGVGRFGEVQLRTQRRRLYALEGRGPARPGRFAMEKAESVAVCCPEGAGPRWPSFNTPCLESVEPAKLSSPRPLSARLCAPAAGGPPGLAWSVAEAAQGGATSRAHLGGARAASWDPEQGGGGTPGCAHVVGGGGADPRLAGEPRGGAAATSRHRGRALRSTAGSSEQRAHNRSARASEASGRGSIRWSNVLDTANQKVVRKAHRLFHQLRSSPRVKRWGSFARS
ncbi:unnamed protein product [Prorocentrum cordatum]|uniref:Uncharacterized protein n=1 Tax=Prorocentrum cordatum TaxID=2364126 RepID=A0ABN9TVH2_9DINO|nr:unnamed protein product [Polarella glacialis]